MHNTSYTHMQSYTHNNPVAVWGVLSKCRKASGEPTYDFGDGGKFAMLEADRARTSVKTAVAKEPPNQQSKFAQAPHVNEPFYLDHGL